MDMGRLGRVGDCRGHPACQFIFIRNARHSPMCLDLAVGGKYERFPEEVDGRC